MNHRLTVSLGLAALMALAGLAGSDTARADQEHEQGPKELHGLRARPDLPIASISLRPEQRGHHPDVGAPRPTRSKCDKDIDTGIGTHFGVTFVAAQDNTICTTADIDVYQTTTEVPLQSYVVQAGGQEAAWTHTNVINPSAPVKLAQYKWSGRGGKGTYTPDVKAFRQGSDYYIAMGLERTTLAGYCGVVIAKVTDPTNATVVKQFIGTDWCDTHNVFVENDTSGEGQYIYATADAPHDMRVLAIKGSWNGATASVSNPIEIGRYKAPTANSDNYVHDITVIDHSGPSGGTIGRRAYLSYWDSGLVILNAADVTPSAPGTNPTPLVGPNVIDPPGFLTHHAYPNAAGTRVFIEDEMTYTASFEPVQMWNIENIVGPSPTKPSYVDGIPPNVGKNGELLPAHNLHVDGNTLYVGWYKAGMQAFSFTNTGFAPNPLDSRVAYHQVQTETSDDAYDGAWGVRLLTIGTNKYVLQSDRRYGLIIGQLP